MTRIVFLHFPSLHWSPSSQTLFTESPWSKPTAGPGKVLGFPQDQGSRSVSHSHLKSQGLAHQEMMRNWVSSGLVSQKGKAKQVPKTKGTQPDLRWQKPEQWEEESWLIESRTCLEPVWNKKCFLPVVMWQLHGLEEPSVGSETPGLWPIISAYRQTPCAATMSLFLHSMWWVKTNTQTNQN